MTPEEYFAIAKDHAGAGRFAAASAYAGLASARAAIDAAPATVRPIYLGDHRPQAVEWCGQCFGPGHRRVKGKPCPRCDSRVFRARPCQYCGAHLEQRPNPGDPEAPWRWRDQYDSLNCPKAPSPGESLPEPAAKEEDLNPDAVWAALLENWRDYGDLADVSSAIELLKSPTLAGYIPKTRLGEVPRPQHFDDWLSARVNKKHGNLLIVEEPSADGVRRWRVTTA